MFKSLAKSVLNQVLALAGPQLWPRQTPALWILMYHRVLPLAEAEIQYEEPGMYVTPESFERQMSWLSGFAEKTHLSGWVNALENGDTLPRRSIAITFDDGWLDNYTYAYPILKKYQVPATIFAVSGMIGTNRAFWPNRLARLLQDQSAAADWPSDLQWLAELTPLKPAELGSSEILSQVIDACKHLPDSEIQRHLDKAETANAGEDASRTMLNWQEMREMQDSGLVDFGCHTENHVRLLDDLPANVLHSEVLTCKLQLEQGTGQSPSLFCYPNGDISKLAEELVSSNYRAAVSTEKGINRQHENIYKLKRIGMHEDVSNTRSAFMARLSGLI